MFGTFNDKKVMRTAVQLPFVFLLPFALSVFISLDKKNRCNFKIAQLYLNFKVLDKNTYLKYVFHVISFN
mgnify:CR=1 FL=1